MSHKEWEPTNVFDLFGDPLARCILVATSGEPLSAEVLAEEFDVSLPTVYRRTSQLVEYDLMREHLRADEAKNQFRVFESILDRITFEVEDGTFGVEIKTTRKPNDDRTRSWRSNAR